MEQEPAKTIEHRDAEIHRVGRILAEVLPRFYGRVSLNLQGGKYVNANIEESLKEKNSKGESE